MKVTTVIKKIFSPWLWANLVAMGLVVVGLFFAVKYGMDFYTHHGEKITVPNLRNKTFYDAEHILEGLGLEIEVGDTGYVKTLPPDCILDQSVFPGTIVKSGRVIYVTVNASSTPTLVMPDVTDNSSYREARTKLLNMGFKVGEPEYIPGERNWVYGVKCKGKLVANGQRLPIGSYLVIQVGDGRLGAGDSIVYTDPEYRYRYDDDQSLETDIEQESSEGAPVESDVDEFEEVTGPE